MDKEKHICRVCGKGFRSEHGLRTHMKADHAGRYYVVRVGIPILAIIIAVALIGLAIGPYIGGQTTTATPTTQQTIVSTPKQPTLKQAPEFSLPIYDPSSSMERYISLSDLAGKPVFLEFFSPTCGYCIKMIPTIEELSRRYGDRMVFLVISTPQREQLENVIERYGLEETVLIDEKLEVFDRYGVEGVPTFIILDSSHSIVEEMAGEQPIEVLVEAVEEAIS